jgi:lipopolysaccharide transport system ATP-binding protein
MSTSLTLDPAKRPVAAEVATGQISVLDLSKLYRVRKRGQSLPITRRLSPKHRREMEKGMQEIWALRDVNLEVSPGEIIGIIGPNGAGKSTLLKILSRITVPTSGQATLAGRVVSLLELGQGFDPNYTGRENVYLQAAMSGIPRSVADERMAEIFEFAGVSKFIDTPVGAYSSGMHLRLAFSAAVNVDPDILLADEVLAVGDHDFQEQCMNRLDDEGSRGVTVLIVSHDMAAIKRLCNRVVWLKEGQIQADGEPREVVNEYTGSTYSWDLADKGAPSTFAGDNSDVGRIQSVRLLSAEGEEIGAVRRSDDFFVEIRARAKKWKVNIEATVVLYNEGVPVFSTAANADDHLPPNAEGEKHLYSPRKSFRGLVRIPGNLLADTVYTAKVSLRLSSASKSALRGQPEFKPSTIFRDNAIGFRVYDTEDQSSPAAGRDRLEGLIRPELEWTIERDEVTQIEEEGPDWADEQMKAAAARMAERGDRGDDEDEDDDLRPR